MTKQEEIRAGTIEFWRDAGEKLTRARTTELTDVYFRWLADKGVVIKVARESPKIPYDMSKDSLGDLIRGYAEARDDMSKAGYVAVEPLIIGKK